MESFLLGSLSGKETALGLKLPSVRADWERIPLGNLLGFPLKRNLTEAAGGSTRQRRMGLTALWQSAFLLQRPCRSGGCRERIPGWHKGSALETEHLPCLLPAEVQQRGHGNTQLSVEGRKGVLGCPWGQGEHWGCSPSALWGFGSQGEVPALGSPSRSGLRCRHRWSETAPVGPFLGSAKAWGAAKAEMKVQLKPEKPLGFLSS